MRRLGALLSDGVASDVRERVGELALWVQRLVDHRARLADAGARAEAGLADPLVESLVARIEEEVRGLVELDRSLADLEEGALVRDLARHRARAIQAALAALGPGEDEGPD